MGGCSARSFFFFFDVFFGWRVISEAFSNFVEHFRPNVVVVTEFLFQIKAPGEVLSAGIDQIDHQSCVQAAFTLHEVVGVGPVVADILAELSPGAGGGGDDGRLAVGPIADDEIGLLVWLHFFEAARDQGLRDLRVDAIRDGIGIQFAEFQGVDAADVGEGFVFGEIEIGVEIDILFGEGEGSKEQG